MNIHRTVCPTAELTDHLIGPNWLHQYRISQMSALSFWEHDHLNFWIKADPCDYLFVKHLVLLTIWLKWLAHPSVFPPARLNGCLPASAREWITHNHLEWQENGYERKKIYYWRLYFFKCFHTSCHRPSNGETENSKQNKYTRESLQIHSIKVFVLQTRVINIIQFTADVTGHSRWKA